MSTTGESLENILKDFSPIAFCKSIVDRGRSPVGEVELVASLSKAAAEATGERPDSAFLKLYEAEESVRRLANSPRPRV